MLFEILHRTRFSYSRAVFLEPLTLRLQPRSDAAQRYRLLIQIERLGGRLRFPFAHAHLPQQGGGGPDRASAHGLDEVFLGQLFL